MSVSIFISDTHIGPGLGPDSNRPQRHAWEWCTEADSARLATFLRWLHPDSPVVAPGVSKPAVDELVLLGDIFDNWIVPHDIKPPTMLELIKSQNAAPVVGALRELAAAVHVLLIPGNHDMTVSGAVLADVLPSVTFGGSALNKPFFSNGRLRAEHGNGPALFNTPDPSRREGLPLGYFISRIVATADRNTGSHAPSTSAIIYELGHLLGKEQLAEGVLDAVCHKAGLSLDTEILMPDDLWAGATIAIRDVRKMYGNLVQEFENRNGTFDTVMAIPAEMGRLDVVADALLLRGGIGALIMGHSHHAIARQYDIPFLGQAAYVNSGCWCNRVPSATWVEVEKRKSASHKRSVLTLKVMQCTGVDSNGNLRGVGQFQPPVLA